MEIRVNTPVVLKTLEDLGSFGDGVSFAATQLQFQTIGAGYSAVSGLDQLGSEHGKVISGGIGAAYEVLRSYKEQVEWLKGALNATHAAMVQQDGLFARGLDIADIGGSVADKDAEFPMRPAPRFESFAFRPPMVRPPTSVNELASSFSATDASAPAQAQEKWTGVAQEILAICTEMREVAASIQENNSGEAFDEAVAKISEVTDAGEVFAANAQTMAGSVGMLSQIHARHAFQVQLAAMSINAIPDPIQRLAAETAYLASFVPAFQADLLVAIPPIDNLMRTPVTGGGGGSVALGVDDVAGRGEALQTAGVGVPGMSTMAANMLDSAQSLGAGDFGTVNGALGDLGINQLATDAASSILTTPTLSNMASPGQLGGLSALGGAGGIGGAGTFGAVPGLGGAGSMGKHAREAINASANKGLTSGASPGMRADSLSGAPTHSATAGMNGAPMTGAVGAGGLGGAGVVRSGAKSLGGLNSGNGSGQAGTGSGGTSASRPSAAVAQGRPQVMMPMGAMGGGAGAGGNTQRRNRGKVQTVTSAVERSGNLKALLGEQPPVVPGVIGDWVRG